MFYLSLSEIKDYYALNDTIDYPMNQIEIIRLLSESIRVNGFPPVVVIVKMLELENGQKLYTPVKDFDLLIQATKMAYFVLPENNTVQIPCILEEDISVKAYNTYTKIRQVIERGQQATNIFVKKMLEAQVAAAKLNLFSELVNNAELDE